MNGKIGIGFTTLVVGGLSLVAVLCLGLASAAGYAITLDSGGLQARNPQAEAEATRTALRAQDEAAQREIQRRELTAEAEAKEAAKPALAVRNSLIAVGVGTGVLILCVSAAFAIGAWLNKRAMTIYPNAAGMYPIITRRGFGWTALHDPNRGLGPSAMYRTPTVLDVLADTIVAIKKGERPRLVGPTAEFPPTGREDTMLQVATQAQAVGLMAATTRPQGMLSNVAVNAHEARQLAGQVMGGGVEGRMPPPRQIDDPQEARRLIQVFEQGGDD